MDSDSPAPAPGPLDGVRVVDLSTWVFGPWAGGRLGDMGADVVKVESSRGDLTRYIGRRDSGFSSLFESLNRNKRSIVLDLREGRALDVLHQLLSTADVLIENLRPAAAVRLGLTWEALHERHPRLIHARATGFGDRGPDAELPAFDIVASARAGYLVATGRPEGVPRRPLSPLADLLAGRDLVQGVVLALYARERLGRGQQVVASLLGSQIAIQSTNLYSFLYDGTTEGNTDRHRDGTALSTWYRAADRGWVTISLLDPSFWPKLCAAVERLDLLEDPRFADPQARHAQDAELREVMTGVFAARPRDEWVAILREFDVPAGAMKDWDEAVDDVQTVANGYIRPYDHPFYGPMRVPSWGFAMSETDGAIRLPAPELGQHTEEVLSELGYHGDEIKAFLKAASAESSPLGW